MLCPQTQTAMKSQSPSRFSSPLALRPPGSSTAQSALAALQPLPSSMRAVSVLEAIKSRPSAHDRPASRAGGAMTNSSSSSAAGRFSGHRSRRRRAPLIKGRSFPHPLFYLSFYLRRWSHARGTPWMCAGKGGEKAGEAAAGEYATSAGAAVRKGGEKAGEAAAGEYAAGGALRPHYDGHLRPGPFM
nr:uncharacterized protein LOC127343378 [Lolium perenne]